VNKIHPPSSHAIQNAMSWGVCLLVFLVPFFPDEKLVRLKLQVLEVGLACVGFGVAWEVFFRARRMSRVQWFVLGWMLIHFFLLLSSDQKALASQEMRRVLLGGGSFLVLSFLPLDKKRRAHILMALSMAAGLLSIYGILQFSGGWGPVQVPQMGRIMGTYGNPIFFAAFLVPTFIISCYLVLLNWKNSRSILFGAISCLQLVAIYLTKTRAAWIALVGSVLFGLVIFRREIRIPKWFWVVAAVGLLLFVGISKRTWFRDQGHLLIWRDTVKMAMQNPLMGVGPGEFHVQFPDYAGEDLRRKWPKKKFIVNYAHNEYLQMFSEVGFVGGCAFLFIIGAYFLKAHRDFQGDPQLKSKALGAFLSMAVMAHLIQNCFSVDMRFSISFAAMFMFMGLSQIPDMNENYNLTASRGLLFGIFIVFLLGFIAPRILKPYQAHGEMKSQVGFFENRLVNPSQTIHALEDIAKGDPDQIPILERLAYTYAKEMKTRDGTINPVAARNSIDVYHQIKKLDPRYIPAYNNLANIYYTLGQREKALLEWRAVLSIDPQFIDAHLNLGKVLYVNGDLKDSAQHFETVLQIDPDNAEAQVYLRRMVE